MCYIGSFFGLFCFGCLLLEVVGRREHTKKGRQHTERDRLSPPPQPPTHLLLEPADMRRHRRPVKPRNGPANGLGQRGEGRGGGVRIRGRALQHAIPPVETRVFTDGGGEEVVADVDIDVDDRGPAAPAFQALDCLPHRGAEHVVGGDERRGCGGNGGGGWGEGSAIAAGGGVCVCVGGGGGAIAAASARLLLLLLVVDAGHHLPLELRQGLVGEEERAGLQALDEEAVVCVGVCVCVCVVVCVCVCHTHTNLPSPLP